MSSNQTGAASCVLGREESRPCRQECLRHGSAHVRSTASGGQSLHTAGTLGTASILKWGRIPILRPVSNRPLAEGQLLPEGRLLAESLAEARPHLHCAAAPHP